jgi:hypothetical protein
LSIIKAGRIVRLEIYYEKESFPRAIGYAEPRTVNLWLDFLLSYLSKKMKTLYIIVRELGGL